METGINSCFYRTIRISQQIRIKNKCWEEFALKEYCFYANERKKNQNATSKKKIDE